MPRQVTGTIAQAMGRRRADFGELAAAGASRTHAAPLARERDEEVVAALPATGAGEPMGEDAAGEITAELALDVDHRKWPDWIAGEYRSPNCLRDRVDTIDNCHLPS